MTVRRPATTTLRWRAVAAAAAVPLLLSACGGVQGGSGGGGDDEDAADFPTKAVELTVPSSPGGSTDLIGRAIARSMEEPLGQSIPVVNKPGANGAVGGKEVLSAAADGYRMVLLFKSLLSIGPLAVDDADAIAYDEMAVVAPLTIEDYVLLVPTDSPYADAESILASTDPISFGTTGVGTGSQLSQALLFGLAGVDATDVPFDGGAPTITALLGDQVDAGVVQLVEAMPQIEAGAVRPLVVFSEERLDDLPDVPTAVELGYNAVVDQRRFLAVPAGTPDEVIAVLQSAVEEAQADPEYQTFLEDNFISVWDAAADEVIPHLEQATEDYAALIEESGITFKAS